MYYEFIQNIINTRGQWVIPEDGYYESHHILPICMGGEPKKRDRNLKHNNLIWLTLEEHFIAHKLLALEYPEERGLIYAWHRMAFSSKLRPELEIIYPEDYALLRKLDIENKKRQWEILSDNEKAIKSAQLSKQMRDYLANEPPEHYNQRISNWHNTMNNRSEEDKIHTSELHSKAMKNWFASLTDREYSEYCAQRKIIMNQPHVKSKISISMMGENNPAKKPESRDKLKKALTGMQFYNNGIINKRFSSSDKIPDGFVKGRIEPTNKKTVKNRIWVNNGIISKMVEATAIPEGFVKGRL